MYPMNNPTNIRPGAIPAMNNRAMDCSAEAPYTISKIEGGIRKPKVPEPASVAIDLSLG